MSEVNSQQRQNAKTAAANASVACNDAAVVLGAGGLLVAGGGVASGVGALAGVGIGLVLGLASFGAWAIGNRYQRLANDPPRDDFNQVTISRAALNVTALPTAEPDATAIRYAANYLILIDAMSSLVTSLERFDGALAANNADNASTQSDAVQSNASLVVATHSAILDLTAPVNQAWAATLGTIDGSQVTFNQVPDFLTRAIDPDSGGLATVLPCVTGLVDQNPFTDLNPGDHPLNAKGQLPPTPDKLISTNTTDTMTALSAPLSTIVDSGNV